MIEGYADFEPIGEGGWAKVYRARAQDGRLVAVKVLHPEVSRDARAVRRFDREGRTLRALDHAAIPRALDVLRTRDDRPALVMELAPGRDLHALLAHGLAGWRPAVRVGVGVVAALDHAHERGVIHRDIKPSNVMLADDPDSFTSVRVLDFGVAFCVDGTRITRASSVGTGPYIAPEQRAGRPGPASDLYALGVTMYQIATGRLPSEPAAPIPDVPSAFEELLRAMMSPDPLRRPATAREVAARLLALDHDGASPVALDRFARMTEELRARELDLLARRNELARLAAEEREEGLSPEEGTLLAALRAAEAGWVRETRELALRREALNAARAAEARLGSHSQGVGTITSPSASKRQ